MVKIITINRYGVPKEVSIDKMDNIYKKCKFRKKDNFTSRHVWRLLMNGDKKLCVHLFAKNTGQCKTINKYELPPPLDKDLFYGTIAVVGSTDKDNTQGIDLTVEMWENIYDKLMGGFENLDEEEEESDEEFVPKEHRTKHGYSKESNFIVDDSTVDYNSSSSSPEEDEYNFSDGSDGSDGVSLHSEEGDKENKITDPKGVSTKGVVPEVVDIESEDELTDSGSELSEEEYENEN